MKKLVFLAMCCLTASVFITGCGANKKIPGDPYLLTFLQEGKTTKRSVIQTLGEPSAIIKSENILTYRIIRTRWDRLVTPAKSWQDVTHSLVLTFDQDNKLSKQSLVKVGGWGK